MRLINVFFLLLLGCLEKNTFPNLFAAEPGTSPTISAETLSTNIFVRIGAGSTSYYNVRGFAIEGKIPLSTNNLISSLSKNITTNLTQQEIARTASELLAPLYSKYTGTNVSDGELLRAALDLQAEYHNLGYPTMIVSVAPERTTNGIVKLNVFQGVVPQILLSGRRYLISDDGTLIAADNLSIAEVAAALGVAVTNPATGGPEAEANQTNTPAGTTNAVPKFAVTSYLITGNTLLSPETLKSIFVKHTGTNIAVGDILSAGLELQKEYRNRGYLTVNVTIPPQKIADGQVKIRVFEGRLSNIIVDNNRYFSSNNVMRALPSLHTNMILNGSIFQAELNRANANQDRQIYPKLEPGPVENTSLLRLTVKDRLPLHAKIELNNQSSPGTPDLRVNSSAVYNNLWQREHSLGVQYNFSPENYKQGNQWAGYDRPLVANYSGFYRLPLGNPESVADLVASQPGTFGYNEATRKFNLPPPSGNSDLTVFASRATIDTGLGNTPGINSAPTTTTNSNNTVDQTVLTQSTDHQDLTVNDDLGARLSIPLASSSDYLSTFSAGLDYKIYKVSSYETNIFAFNGVEIDYTISPPATAPIHYTDYSPVPATYKEVDDLPISFRYDASWKDAFGAANFGLGLNINPWFSASQSKTSTSTNISTQLTGKEAFQAISGSKKSSGHWVTLNANFSQNFEIVTNWPATFRADGQLASEPLISTEQFGAGGVNSVRGYPEGDVFGDSGWHVSLEQQTPPHIVGQVFGSETLTIRGSLYMDFADTYLLDPQGRPASTALWGTGFGGIASVGSHWQARFLFSWPLLRTPTTEAFQPFFNFSLTAQF